MYSFSYLFVYNIGFSFFALRMNGMRTEILPAFPQLWKHISKYKAKYLEVSINIWCGEKATDNEQEIFTCEY